MSNSQPQKLHPNSSPRGGSKLSLLPLTLVPVLGAAVFLSWRFRQASALHPFVSFWIVLPIPAIQLRAAAVGLGLASLLLLGNPRSRSWGWATTLTASLLFLLSSGPIPSPWSILFDLASVLETPGARQLGWMRTAEGGALALCLASAVFAVDRAGQGSGDPARVAHGTAHLATAADLRQADFLSGEGVVLGAVSSWTGLRPLTDRSADHVLVVMPPGGGKTTGPVAGTLLNVDSSALVLDPKGELWNLTAGWRAERGQRLVRFSPQAGGSTSCWNPLLEIEKGSGEMAAVSAITDNLVTYPAERHGDNHWIASARSLLRCLILHVIYSADRESSFEAVRKLLMSKSDFDELFRELQKTPHQRPDGKTHPEVARLARVFEATPHRERGSIISTLARFLDLWGDPRICEATAKSEWSLEQLAQSRTTIYVTVPTGQLGRISPLLRILVALLTFRTTTTDQDFQDQEAAGDAPLYLVLDEFASLGRIPLLEDMLAFLRGYGVRCLVVVQDLSQLRRLYGPHHSISATCRIHVAAASADVATRQEISRRLGESTHTYKKRSRTGNLLTSRRTTSQAEVRRPLLTEGEIGSLPESELLIVKAGHPPVRAQKLPFWLHPQLAARCSLVLPSTEAPNGEAER